MVDVNDVYIIVSIISGAAIAAFIIWNSSKRFTILEKDSEQGRVNLLKELARIQEQHREDVKQLELEIQRQVVERRDDITKTSLLHKDDMNRTQSIIEGTKADVKSLLSKIEVNNTNIEFLREVDLELKQEDRENKKFFVELIQRIEDKIEDLRKELMANNKNKNGTT